MNRLTLAGQVALIVAAAIFLAQIFNLGIAIDHRRDLAISQAVIPAAQRLMLAIERPDFFEQRAAARERHDHRRPPGARGQRFVRPQHSEGDPLPPGATRIERAERVLLDRFDEAGIDILDARVGTVEHARARHVREMLIFAVQREDGWLAVRAPGPPSMKPLVTMLSLQALLIGLAILLPTLWLLRRVGGSLTRLEEAARRFDGTPPRAPVPATGPRDVASLIGAVNAMQARIATMIGEKDVMLGAIGHDLRTPLTALRIEAEEVEDPERRTALVGQIERLHRQFEAILELARSARPLAPGQRVDVASLLDRLATTYRGRPVSIGQAGHGSFPGDPVAVERALANLVDNGLRHASNVTVTPRIDAKEIAFVVEDDGPGIAEEDRERFLLPFERGEASRNRETGGDGLGLAIVSAIARRHHGHLALSARADGEPGLGATITFPHLSEEQERLH